jgi:hypothetical protein
MKRIRNAKRQYRLEGLVIQFRNGERVLLVQSEQNKIIPIAFGELWAGCANAVIYNLVDHFIDKRNATKKEIYEKFAHIGDGVKRIFDNYEKKLSISLVKA